MLIEQYESPLSGKVTFYARQLVSYDPLTKSPIMIRVTDPELEKKLLQLTEELKEANDDS